MNFEDCFEPIPDDVTRWDLVKEVADLGLGKKRKSTSRVYPNVQLLPRQNAPLYGSIPKMEQRVYSKCKECRLVFNTRDILLHKSCVARSSSERSTQSVRKKDKVQQKKKPSHSSSPTTMFKKPSLPSPVAAASVLESKPALTNSNSTPSPKSEAVPPVSSSVKVSVAKSEQKVFSNCKECRAVFTPKDQENSKCSKCSTKSSESSSSHKKKLKSKKKSHRSASSSSASPSSFIFKRPATPPPLRTHHTSESKSKSHTANSTSPKEPVKAHSSRPSHGSSSSSSRNKKSRKNNKVSRDFDPDSHCGVVEGTKGPCTRSVTCSNHRIQLRKLVPGRSKNIHQLIAEKKAANDLKNSYPSLNVEEKEIFRQNTSYVPIVATIVSTASEQAQLTATFVPIVPKATELRDKSQTAPATPASKQSVTETVVIENKKTLDNRYKSIQASQESAIGTVPVVYMPMNPISVVSPVQFVQIGKNLICLESPQSAMSPPLQNHSLLLTIPDQPHQPHIKMYNTHPKPVGLPAFGTRRVGGAILLANQRIDCQRIDCQRKDISMALNTAKTSLSQAIKAGSALNNSPHRPNILKVKSTGKSLKRPSSEKLTIVEGKQIRLTPDVNGFILHSDMSESADAPQPNICIQDKIALLNMK